MNRNRQYALLRAAVQLFFFLMMPGAFVAGFNGIRYIFEQVGSQKPIAFNSFLIIFLCLCAFTILFGRFFCGFVCAFGSMGDLINWISGTVQKKLLKRKKKIQLPEKILRILQKMKYLVLAVILILCAFGLYSKVSGYDPWTVFSLLTSLRFSTAGFAGGAIVLVLIMIGSAFQERFFCQFLCPLGAIFSVLPVLPFSFIQRNPDLCLKGCSNCKKVCPVSIKLEQDGFRNGECISCEKCTGVCPKKNLTRWDLRIVKYKWISVLIRAGIFFAMGCLLGLCRFF